MAAIIEKAKDLLSGHEGNQAAWIKEKGARLHVDRAEMPVPAEHEILIKNHAAAVNPVDWKIQESGFFLTQWPNVLGCDVAGEVVAVGSNVTKFKQGDRVLAHVISIINQNPTHGGFSLFSAAADDRTALIPSPEITFREATVLPLAISTAAEGLYLPYSENFLGLPEPSPKVPAVDSGKTIVIWGASSSVGAVAVQFAKASGAKIVATASAHNHELVRGWGVTEVVDYGDADVVGKVVDAVRRVGGEYGGVFDAISYADKSYPPVLAIAKGLGGGNVAVVRGPPDGKDIPEGVRVGAVFAGRPIRHRVWEDFVTPALESGALRCLPEPLVVGKGLDKVQEGLDKNKEGVSAKKVVIEL